MTIVTMTIGMEMTTVSPLFTNIIMKISALKSFTLILNCRVDDAVFNSDLTGALTSQSWTPFLELAVAIKLESTGLKTAAWNADSC